MSSPRAPSDSTLEETQRSLSGDNFPPPVGDALAVRDEDPPVATVTPHGSVAVGDALVTREWDGPCQFQISPICQQPRQGYLVCTPCWKLADPNTKWEEYKKLEGGHCSIKDCWKAGCFGVNGDWFCTDHLPPLDSPSARSSGENGAAAASESSPMRIPYARRRNLSRHSTPMRFAAEPPYASPSAEAQQVMDRLANSLDALPYTSDLLVIAQMCNDEAIRRLHAAATGLE